MSTGRVKPLEQASHNKTRSDADEKITSLEASLQTQIDRTSKSSSNMTATMAQVPTPCLFRIMLKLTL